MTQRVWHTRVEDDELRRFVVRIVEPGSNVTRGSGVLVAPGWVLSCAHVVEDLERVCVVPDSRAATEGVVPSDVTGWVRARSDTRLAGSETAFWPFPDLAVIELEGWSDHLIAPLVLEPPLTDGKTHAWGFGRREAGVRAKGSPASFEYVGREGDEWYKLKAGDATAGLSGAPLVCPDQRGVVGVMSVSRDPTKDCGGWASPAWALSGDRGARGELARLGAQIIDLNKKKAWEHRDTWSRVLRVTGADQTVDMPWKDLERLGPHQRPAPSMMLRAESCLVPYLLRGDDLPGVSWCQSQSPFEISYIDAQGGAGKTRFAIELCQKMQDRGWVAGILPRKDRGISEITQPRLVAVDYVEERDSAALAEQISGLVRSAKEMTPVRVLLLSRPTRGQRPGARARMDVLREQEAASPSVVQALDDAEDSSAAVQPLTVSERETLFDSALHAFGHTWHDAEWIPQISGQVDLSAERYGKPLDVLLEAFDAALSGPEWQSGSRPPVERALDHEENHWRPAVVLGVDNLVRRRCVALATLVGARDQQEADALLLLVPKLAGEQAAAARGHMDRWLKGLYDGPDRWNPLRPDRLAEALVTQAVQEAQRDDDGGSGLIAEVLALKSDRQVERALDVLARLDNEDMALAVASALTERFSALVGRCRRQVQGQPGRIGLLEGLARLHTAVLTAKWVAGRPIPEQSQLCASVNDLGDLARDHGLIEDATGLYEQGLGIATELAALEPENADYKRHLSIFYDRFGFLAQRAGNTGEATTRYQKGLGIVNDLAALKPENADYKRHLSSFYDRLAGLAHRAGHIKKATEHYRQAVEFTLSLIEVEQGEPDDRRRLSNYYGKLADLARDHGNPGEADKLYDRGLRIAEHLADQEPANSLFQRDLAVFYDRLADRAQRTGHTDKAKSLYEKGLKIAEVLADGQPGNTGFQRDQAISYDRLGDLASDTGEATRHYQKALDIREDLAEREKDSTGFQRDLSISYNRLGDLARDNGNTEEATRHYQKALDIRKEVVESKRDDTGYQRDEAISYERLGDLARENGNTEEATRHYQKALDIRKEVVVELKPTDTDWLRDLSISYDRLADLAQRAGQTDEATQRYQEARDIAKKLAELDPDNVDFQRDLSLLDDRLADLDVGHVGMGDAPRKYRHAFDLCERLF